MEEIEEIHTRGLEWGAVANLIDKISTIEEGMDGHWDELLDMIADMVDSEGEEKDPTKVFFDVYAFCFRLYYRLRSNPTRRKFNKVIKITTGGEEAYQITNYDFKTFKWAREEGLMWEVSNDNIILPSNKLTTNQQRALERRIGD